MRSAVSIAGLVLLSACQRGPSEPVEIAKEPAPLTTSANVQAAPSKPTPLAPPAAVTGESAEAAKHVPASFGAPIRGTDAVTLADVARDPKKFRGKTIVTTGTVSAVCQERGCWMEITDASKDANVRMHGHSFFVPKTASGKKARVEGTVVLVKDGKECDEMAATGAELELDATGVELL